MSPIDQIRPNGTSWTEWTEQDSTVTIYSERGICGLQNGQRIMILFTGLESGTIHPSLLIIFYFVLFYFNLLNFHFLFLLTFLNQWLRLKVAFCKYQSQPFIGIASGAISRILHLLSIIYLLVTCQSFFKMKRN